MSSIAKNQPMKEKSRLLLPEYGRNVQEMVNYLKSIEDRDLRNSQAEVVVAIMGNVNPAQRDSAGFKHMLWDHLFMIADFDLDVDSPYPHPTPDMFAPLPVKVPYTQGYIALKQYGGNVRRMARSLSMPAGSVLSPDTAGAGRTAFTEEERTEAALGIARFMRSKSFEYNREYPSNDQIVLDLRDMSEGVLNLEGELLGRNPEGDVQGSGKKTRPNGHNGASPASVPVSAANGNGHQNGSAKKKQQSKKKGQ